MTTDGRIEYLGRSLKSGREQLRPYPPVRVIVDDSGDATTDLIYACPGFMVAMHTRRKGFTATVEDAWRITLQNKGVRYVFHAEDDFTYNEPVDLLALAAILDANPHLAQVALKRDPVNAEEEAAGGFMETRPPETWEQRDGFVEHDLNFTTNPSLIPRAALEVVIDSGRECSEPNVTETLRAAGFRFAYFGTVDDPPRVTHIGARRMEGAIYP